MKNEIFNQIVEDTVSLTKETLIRKGGEYATDDDRLHNFRVAARKLGVTESKALLGMDVKHVVSIEDLTCGLPAMLQGKHSIRSYIDEKIGDHINYMILLKAILYERYGIV